MYALTLVTCEKCGSMFAYPVAQLDRLKDIDCCPYCPPKGDFMKHACMWPGCDAVVPASQWGCREHWFALPRPVRLKIGRAYRQGIHDGTHPTRRYVDAHNNALAWIARHEGEGDGLRD